MLFNPRKGEYVKSDGYKKCFEKCGLACVDDTYNGSVCVCVCVCVCPDASPHT